MERSGAVKKGKFHPNPFLGFNANCQMSTAMKEMGQRVNETLEMKGKRGMNGYDTNGEEGAHGLN